MAALQAALEVVEAAEKPALEVVEAAEKPAARTQAVRLETPVEPDIGQEGDSGDPKSSPTALLNPTQSPSNTKAAAKGAFVEKAATSAARVASGGSDDSASQARANAPGASAAPTGLDGDVAGRGPNDREEVCLDRDEGPDGGESSDPEVKVLHDLPVGCLSVGLCIRIFFITRIVSLSRVPDEANTLKEKRTFHAVRPFPWRGPTCADLEPAGRSCAAFHLLRDEQMAR
jgi:hypothetical protein